jgi:hypothetical protein
MKIYKKILLFVFLSCVCGVFYKKGIGFLSLSYLKKQNIDTSVDLSVYEEKMVLQLFGLNEKFLQYYKSKESNGKISDLSLSCLFFENLNKNDKFKETLFKTLEKYQSDEKFYQNHGEDKSKVLKEYITFVKDIKHENRLNAIKLIELFSQQEPIIKIKFKISEVLDDKSIPITSVSKFIYKQSKLETMDEYINLLKIEKKFSLLFSDDLQKYIFQHNNSTYNVEVLSKKTYSQWGTEKLEEIKKTILQTSFKNPYSIISLRNLCLTGKMYELIEDDIKKEEESLKNGELYYPQRGVFVFLNGKDSSLLSLILMDTSFIKNVETLLLLENK